MSNGSLSLRDLLSNFYYLISIAVVVLGMSSVILNLKWRVDALEIREQEHPTKQELATVAVRVEDRLNSTDKRINDLDLYGTRALGDRTTQIEQSNRQQDERIQTTIKRVDTLQESLNKLSGELPIIAERQNYNTNAIKELQQRVWSSGGERGPTGPTGPTGPGSGDPRPHK